MFLVLCFSVAATAQNLSDRLKKATSQLLADSQMRYATLGWLVIDADSGDTLVSWNANTGLPPASCLKLITSATAYELLGPSFRFTTGFLTDGEWKDSVLAGNIFIEGNGDPALGSHRFLSTRPLQQIPAWITAFKKAGISRIKGKILPFNKGWSGISTPGGYTWNDIGNYYGAGSDYLNWRENQYDLLLRSGPNVGDKVEIVAAQPAPLNVKFRVTAKAADKGTGDQANIYLAALSKEAIVDGTIPRGEQKFVIAGSIPDPPAQLVNELSTGFRQSGLLVDEALIPTTSGTNLLQPVFYHYSPALDSLNYWFLKKSVNLYGEAFVRAIAKENGGDGSLEEGISRVKKFWKARGVDPGSLKIVDGSGLSPQNRVTPGALVRVLQYARRQWWFNLFLQSFPRYNDMTLKSGTIGGVKSFAGYHTTPDGKNVILSIIINNFDGSSGSIVNKMFTLLDEFKK